MHCISGSFLLIDGKSFEVTGRWEKDTLKFGYDYWYQPRHNVMFSTEFGAPSAFRGGFNPAHVSEGIDVFPGQLNHA